MKAIEFIQKQYNEGRIKKWKPEMIDAISSFMEAYAEQQTKELKEYVQHKYRCHSMNDVELPCICGLEQALNGGT